MSIHKLENFHIRSANSKDYENIEKYLHGLGKNKIDFDLDNLKFDRMINFFVYYLNDDMLGFSGIDDLNYFLPNTLRVLTRGTQTKNVMKYNSHLKCHGKTFEEKMFTTTIAGFFVKYCELIQKNCRVVLTANENSKFYNFFSKSSKNYYYLFNKHLLFIYGHNKYVLEVDKKKCVELTNLWCKNHGLNFNEIFSKL